jgi:acyl phosphate:glycerol-3-phosphate acyltransferase
MPLALIGLSYFIGAVPTGLLLVRLLKGEDIRQLGSGNIGAVNVLRVAGVGTGVAVLVVDILKGLIPVLLATRLNSPAWLAVLCGIAAIAGHNWSVFLGFRGGKGIATSYGVLIGLSWPAAAVAAAVWVGVVAVTRYASLGSLLGVACVPFALWWLRQPIEYVYFGILAALFAIYRHRGNIQRLVAGSELRITDRGTPRT